MKPYQDEHGKNIINNYYGILLAVDSIEGPGYFSLWDKGSKIGNFTISGLKKHPETNKKYGKIYSVDIDRNYRGKGLGKWLYLQVLNNLPKNVFGLYSYLPNTANKLQVPKIHKRLNAKVIDGDHLFIDKPTVLESVLIEIRDS